MGERISRKLSLLVSVLLLFQFLIPMANAFASSVNSNILPPSNLNYQLTTPKDVKLTWSSVYGANGYNVYEITDGQLVMLDKVSSTSYTLKDLDEGSYSYVVSTLTAEGESGPSAPVNVDISYPEMQAPASVTHTIQNGNDIVLSWTASANAEEYNIYQLTADGEKTLVSSATTRTYKITNAPAGTYSYAVSAEHADFGESSLSEPVVVTVVFPVMEAPASPTYSIANGNDITLKWAASAYATEYKVYQVINNEKVLKSTVSSRTVTYTNMPSGEYVYEIYSYSDRFGESKAGSVVTLSLGDVAMAAPTNFAYKIQNVNDIVLTWTRATNAESYKIYQIIGEEKVLKSTVTGATVTYTNQPAGNYVFEIRSYSERFGESQEGRQVTFTLGEVTMVAPGNFTYTTKNVNDIVLTWSSVANANSYKIYQVVGEEKVLKSTVTGTSVTYTNQPSGEYVFEIHSYSDRFGESQEGNTLTFVLGDVVLVPPGNLAYNVKNGNDIVLTWSAAATVTGYKVYQIKDGQKVLKSTLSGTTATYANQPAGEYSFEVYSYSTRFGESQEGSKLSLTLVHPTMLPPANLVQTIKSATDFSLSWDAVEYATGYKVYQIKDGQKTLKSSVSGTTVTYTSQPSGEYTFEVHSVSTRFGESAIGSKLTFTMNGQTMEAPTNLTQTIANGNDITLKWNAAPYATSYKVYQMVDGQKTLKSTATTTTARYNNQPAGDYTFVVHSASTALGESPVGAELTFTLVHPTMTPPENFAYTVKNGNDIALTWAAVPYANTYKVYELVGEQKVLKATVSTLSATITNVAAGEHTYLVHSVSTRFGESQEGAKLKLNLVQSVMTAPANLTYTIANGNDVTLKWNAVTYANSYKVYQVIGEEKVLKKTVTGTAVSFPNSAEGEYLYEVHSFSNDFGESPEGSQVSFTLVFPIMQPPADLTQTITSGNDITLKWAAATYATAYKVYQIVDGQRVLKSTVTTNYAKYINMPEGDYSYEVTSFSDQFGESPVASKLTFTLTWPKLVAPELKKSAFNVNNITFTWSAATWANEYRLYQVKGDTRQLLYKGTALTYKVYNLSEDTHHFELTLYNTRFGESAPSNRVSETIVYPIMQPPVANLKLTSETSAQISWNFITYANGYNVYEIIDGNPVMLTKGLNNLSYTVSNLSYADHQFYVTSLSNSFGESKPSNVVVAKLIVDTEAPVTTATAPTEWTNKTPVTVTLSATDSGTGVAKTYYSVNDAAFAEGTTVTLNSEGIYNISYYSVDKVGNKESAKTIAVKVDKTAPVTKASDFKEWSVEEIVLTANDEASGVAKTFYSVNGSDFVEGTTVKIEKEGLNQVSFYSVDQAGNKEEARVIEVKVDKTAPVTSYNAPAGWQKDNAVVTFAATDAASGVAKTFYSINGSSFVEGTSVTVEKEGVNEVTFYSIDLAGNAEQVKMIEVKVDKTAPVTKTSEIPEWSGQEFTLVATDAASGVAKTFYSINGSEFTEGTLVKVEEEGVHKVSFYSVDLAGNAEQVKTIEVKVDKTAPVTEATAPTAWAKADVDVTLSATDALSGVEKTFYAVDGAPFAEGSSLTIREEGIHTIVYYSVDKAGNKEADKTVVVKIDKTAPVITMELQELYKLGESVQLNYVAKDQLSGIASEKMTVIGPNESTGKVVENGGTFVFSKPGTYKISVTVTDAAGLTTTIQKQANVYIPATIEVTPKVLKGNNGVFTVRVSLPKGYGTEGFDLNTATLNGVKALASNNGYYNQAKQGQFKFERSDFTWTPSDVTVSFRGYVNGFLVMGETVVKVQK